MYESILTAIIYPSLISTKFMVKHLGTPGGGGGGGERGGFLIFVLSWLTHNPTCPQVLASDYVVYIDTMRPFSISFIK